MSGGEILLILVIYLLLFGAKGIPSLAQTLGRALYQFRNAAKDVQNEILQSADEVRKQASAVRLDQLDVEPSTLRNENRSHFPPPPVPPVSGAPTQAEPKQAGTDPASEGTPV